MYGKIVWVIGAFFYFTELALPSQAAILFSFEQQVGARYSGFADSVNYRVVYLENPGEELFANQYFTVNDIGNTITLLEGDDPNFASFTAKLTDGAPETLGFQFHSMPNNKTWGLPYSEAQVVWADDNDPRIDLQGYSIDSYSMTLESLVFNYYPDGSSEYFTTVRFSAEGTPVPEPATLAMLFCAFTGLLWWRRQAY